MALLSTKFKTRIAIVDRDKDFLEFDATLSTQHTGNAQVTDHPVESSTDIADHVRRLPEELQIRGVVTNSPVLALASVRATPSVPGTDPATRAEAAYLFLKDIKDNGRLVNVSTALQEYTNMAITALSIARDKDSSNIVDVALTLREIQIATTEIVGAVSPAKRPATKLGKKTKTPANPATAAKSQSLLTKLFSAFGG